MSKPLRIVAIGAGSASFGKGVLTDVLGSPEFNDLDCTLVLVDTDPEALRRMHSLAERLREHHGSMVRVEATTNRLEALPEANYVITSVARRRFALWEQDFRVPLAYGFKHVEGENGGPGAAFHTMRSFDLMVPIARDIERLCPDAMLLNFTNPESRVMMAVSKLTKVRGAGLCHGIITARRAVCDILQRPEKELDILTGGLNHFFWILSVTDRTTHEDLYPRLRDRILNDPRCPMATPISKKMLEVFGLYMFPSDYHIGEYLAFAHEFVGLRWHNGQEARPVPLVDQPEAGHPLDDYANGTKPIDSKFASKSGEFAVSIILDVELDRGRIEPAVNVPNDETYIENLAQDAIVEVPATVDRSGIHPMHVGALPEPLAAYCARQVSIQKLLVEAYAHQSRNLLLQALLLDPLVDSVANAERMLDEMLELQKDYLPRFS